jgi:hypothetical protein
MGKYGHVNYFKEQSHEKVYEIMSWVRNFDLN